MDIRLAIVEENRALCEGPHESERRTEPLPELSNRFLEQWNSVQYACCRAGLR